jgi:cell wall-associated NlpC family hydrolase
MRVIDGAKARALAIAMTLVASIQLWPNAEADNNRRAAETAELSTTNTTKKTKRKKPSARTHTAVGPWHRTKPIDVLGGDRTSTPKKKLDPIDLVLQAAKEQLGEPYRWGAVGPDSFDCSGFTMYAWRAGGVELPHNSSAQNAATKDVPLDELRPGDLIFSPGHVGMYYGKGKMIHSPHSGRTVEIAPLHSNAYVGGRPKA